MNIKKIVLLINITFFCFQTVGMEEEKNPTEQLRQFKKAAVVIPSLELKNNEIFNFLVTLKTQSYDQSDFDDLDEDSKNFLEARVNLTQQLQSLNNQLEQSPLIFSKLKIFKKLCDNLEKLADPLIFSIVEEYKIQSCKRLNAVTAVIDKVKILKEEDTLFIVVFPEGFFNFFKNPSEFGSFIPFFDKEWKGIVSEASKKTKNVVIFANIIHSDIKQNVSKFDNNFQEFIKNCYEQKEILSAYAKYEGLEAIPIFNETFVFYAGEELGSYKKQFILDEDIPFMKSSVGEGYLSKERLLYVPGISDQHFAKDLFAIEICQDHIKIQNKKKSRLLIIQSASIDIANNLPDIYEGICVHSDIDIDKCGVYDLSSGKISSIKERACKQLEGLTFKIYDLGKW